MAVENDVELRRLERRLEHRDPHLSTIIVNNRPVLVPHGDLALAIMRLVIAGRMRN